MINKIVANIEPVYLFSMHNVFLSS